MTNYNVVKRTLPFEIHITQIVIIKWSKDFDNLTMDDADITKYQCNEPTDDRGLSILNNRYYLSNEFVLKMLFYTHL